MIYNPNEKIEIPKIGMLKIGVPKISLPNAFGSVVREEPDKPKYPDWFMQSIVCWYDPHRQGCTNENMVNNPVLKDLSGKGLDMGCHDFAWTNESGITEDKGINFDGVTSYCLQIPTDRPQLNKGFTVIYKRKFEDDYVNEYLIADNNTINTKCVFAFVVSSGNTVFNIRGNYQYLQSSDGAVIKDKAIEYLVDDERTVKYHYADGRIRTLTRGNYLDEEKFPFVIGRVRTVSPPWNEKYSRYTLYSLLIFSKGLTEEEIEWVKTNLMQ